MRYKIRMLIETCIGVPVANNMESRIFNTVSLIIAGALILNALFNFFVGLPFLGMLMFLASLIAISLYYLARVKNKLSLAVLLFGLIGTALFIVNFYYNSGIEGPTILVFILLLFLLMTVAPKKQQAFWMVLNTLVVFVLLLSSYYYPHLSSNTYPSRFERFADLSYSYIVVTLLIGLVTLYLKNTYNQQKKILENKARQLNSVNQTKDKLMSIIAHDLRSPLASIQNYLEVLSEFKFSEEEKERMEHELLLKTRNTDQLLSNLLYWTMNQMNGVKVKLTTINLNEVIAPVLHIIDVAAHEKGIEIDNLLPENVYLTADQDMIQIMMRNLVNNAVKFTPHGGRIVIGCETENEKCKVKITDNGVGIPQNQRGKIFSLKSDSTYGTNQEKGTGLGLVLCKEFAELQHGTIGFESEINIGTTFYFVLTLVKQAGNTAEIKPAADKLKNTSFLNKSFS